MASVPVQERVSIEEYLSTAYRPDCDYVDGVIEERNLGELDHSWVQANIISFFRGRFQQTGLSAVGEWRFQVGPTRFRVPDVVVTRGKPSEQILTQAPLLCIEILSPGDRPSNMEVRIWDYLEIGVPAVWLIDPVKHAVSIYRNGSIDIATDPIAVEGTDVVVPFSAIFE